MNLAYFMAKRLYGQGGETGRVSRLAIGIATAGVALGLSVMILSIAVVLGFKQEVRDKVTGIGSHIQIINYESLYRTESQPVALSDSLLERLSAIPNVTNVQRFCLKGGMLKTESDFQGVMFKGIGQDYDIRFLRQHLVSGDLGTLCTGNSNDNPLLISAMLARQLRLQTGDRVYAYFFDQQLRARRFTVCGIYETHLEEYDSKLVFCDFDLTRQLAGFEVDQASGAEMIISDFKQLDTVSDAVYSIINRGRDCYGASITAPTIRDLYPSIFSWLDLLDVNVIVILALMMAVACFTTISGLLIIILERTQFIGTMKALGAKNNQLRRIFLQYSLFIIGRGIVLGDVLGLGLCLAQRYLGLVHLDAQTYYVDAVPISISWSLVAALNIGVAVISAAVLVLPSYLVSRIHPARSIRFE